ncbi:MAG TPA: phosphate ABC transporter permease PstA [Galbitalea sp.]|jgi:phosphate transport system permease protein|nr:phosphate ABC transporter permease PstA [Galbitalea sp.]
MTSPTTARARNPIANTLTAGKLPRGTGWYVLAGSWIAMGIVVDILQGAPALVKLNVVAAIFFGTILYGAIIFMLSSLVEGGRKAKDRLVTALVTTAFIIALLPLISLLYTVAVRGAVRFFDTTFFTESMRNIVGPGGGELQAIVGTLEITAFAAVISIPIGLMTSIYLVEYGRGHLARAITFFVDVMTGIPSIVAGLFAFALFDLVFGTAVHNGAVGAVALAVLMIPIVVRSSEEILKIVPNELREASYALGVPKWLTIVRIVLPTSIAGITTGIMLSIARVIGETAPLLLTAGFSASMNYNLFSQQMQTLPVFVYTQYSQQEGSFTLAYNNRAWAAALTLVVIVVVLNLVGRIIARAFAPKLSR